MNKEKRRINHEPTQTNTNKKKITNYEFVNVRAVGGENSSSSFVPLRLGVRFFVLCSLFFVLFSLFSACDNPLSQPVNIPPGKGAFSLSVSVAGTARTILPDTPQVADFKSYTLEFELLSGDTVSVERTPANLNEAVFLDTGTYTLTVTAYLDSGMGKPAARGVDTITIIAGDTTSQVIELSVFIDTITQGDFSYTVTFPSDATATMAVNRLNPTGSIPNPNPLILSNGTGATLNLNTGYYNVVFTLKKTNGDTLIWREILHVYASLNSPFTKTFTDADFYKTVHTVTLVYNDGLTGNGNESVEHGGKVSDPSPLPKTGWTLSGWYRDAAFTNAWNFNSNTVTADTTLYAKWTYNTAVITISVNDIIDNAPDIEGETISRNDTGGFPTSIELTAPAGSAYQWSIEGVGSYAGTTVTGIGQSFKVDATNTRYNSIGKHAVYLRVTIEGVPYSKTIWVTITEYIEADFGSEAVFPQNIKIENIFNVYNPDDWSSAKTAISDGGTNKNYIINIMDGFSVAGGIANTFTGTNIKVSLRGAGRTMSLSNAGNLIRTASNQTVILRDLTLQGLSGNNNSVVYVDGTNSVFTMQSGKITGNTSSGSSGGGVYVVDGTFEMNGGEISLNEANNGGGVYVAPSKTFTMNNGTIFNNIARTNGGGVYVNGNATFVMKNGIISGNTSTNTTNGTGGGVFMQSATFRIVNGIIYGSNGGSNGNTASTGAALTNTGGTAQHGTFSGTGGAWVSKGNLTTRNNTIRVVNGDLIIDLPITDVNDIVTYLTLYATGGTRADDPASLPIALDLGNMTVTGSNWRLILAELEKADKFVDLDLSKCTIGGTNTTVFNPVYSDETGKDLIVSIALPDTAISIADGNSSTYAAFRHFTVLESFSGTGLKTIGHFVFLDCANLTMKELPADIISIGSSAFSGCTNLALTELPEGITEIGGGAFSRCTNLALTSLPEGLNYIGGSAFSGCTNLALTELPMGITEIGSGAFARCTNLALTKLPPNLTIIHYETFTDCTNLKLDSLPLGIESIGNQAFSYCTSLALTSLPSGLTSIGFRAFYHCTGLITLSLPATLKTISNSAFSECTGLVTVTLREGLTSIGDRAFDLCTRLTSITLPTTLTDIGNMAFQGTPVFVISFNPSPPSAGDVIFNYGSLTPPIHPNLKIYVPEANVNTYKAAPGWNTYESKIDSIEKYYNDTDFGTGVVIPSTNIFNVSNLNEWNAARTVISGGGDDKNYIINVTADFSVPNSNGPTFGTSTTYTTDGITVSLRGVGRTLSLSSDGTLIWVGGGYYSSSAHNVILRDLTLRGLSPNGGANSRVVNIEKGTFKMHSGEISGNTSNDGGGGVYVDGTFTMYGGEISGNSANYGGGVAFNNNYVLLRIVTGTIYGSNEADPNLRNTAISGGAALWKSSNPTVEYGTFSGPGGAWVLSGTLTTTENTIRVVNGVLIP